MTFDDFESRFRAVHAPHAVDAAARAALDRIGAAFAASPEVYTRRSAICAEIGRAQDDTLRSTFVAARDDYETTAIAAMLAELDATFARSPQAGWEAWLHQLALTIVEGFRHRFARALCAHRFAIPEQHLETHRQLCRAAACMEQARWEEVIDEVALLAAQPFLPARVRARVMTIQAQIEMWRFSERDRAGALLRDADALAPNDTFVLSTLGDLAMESGDAAAALPLYERAIEAGPGECNGYVGIAEMHLKEDRFDDAREWFDRAMRMAPGEASSYERMTKVLGRKGELQHHLEDVERLRVRREAIDPEGEYDALLSLGDLFRDDGRLDDAHALYERARRLQPRCPRTDVAAGEMSRIAGDLAGTERHARRAIELDPAFPGAHLMLAQLLEDQGRWEEARRAFEAFPARPARWKLYARAATGRMLGRLGRVDEAHAVLRAVLAAEVDSPLTQTYATGELESLARRCSEELQDEHTALAIYEELLAAKGPDYRARFHNLVGNVHYYRSRWETAIEHYRAALAAKPGEAVYHRYIAGAYRSMERYAQALEEIDAAFDLDGDAARRDQERAAVASAQGDAAGAAGRQLEAIEHYQRAVETDPATPGYLVALAQAHERLDAPGQRIAHLREAVALFRRAHELGGDPRLLERAQALERRASLAATHGEQVLGRVNVVTPIVVEVASDLVRFVEGPSTGALHPALAAEVATVRDAITADFGIVVPGIRFRGNEGTLGSGTAVVMIDEVPLVSSSVPGDRRFVAATPQQLEAKGVRAEPAQDPVDGSAGAWVDAEALDRLGGLEGQAWSPQRALMRQVDAVLRRNLADLLGIQEVAALLEEVAEPVRSTLRERPALMVTLVNVCRGLLAEGVTLAPFRELCSSVLSMHADRVRPREMVERIRLLPGFRDRLPGRASAVGVRTTDRFEAALRQGLYRHGDQAVLALEPAACQQALAALPELLRERGRALVVADAALRPFVRKLVEMNFPELPVLSAAETRDGASVAVERIDLALVPPPASPPFAAPSTPAATSVATPAPETDPAAAAPAIDLGLPAGRNGAHGSSADDPALADAIALMRDTLFHELGLLLPEVTLRTQASLPAGRAELRIGEAAPQSLAGEPTGVLVDQLAAALRACADRFQTPACTQHMLDGLQPAFAELVERTVERFSIGRLTQILRHLLADQVSVRDLPGLLNALLCVDATTDVDLDRFVVFTPNAEPLCPDPLGRAPADLPPTLLADYLRTTQKRALSHRHAPGGSMEVLLLDRALEQRLREIPARPLTDEEHKRLVAAVRTALPLPPEAAGGPALLTSFDVRTPLRRALRDAFPALPVLCYQELAPELSLHPLSRIEWG